MGDRGTDKTGTGTAGWGAGGASAEELAADGRAGCCGAPLSNEGSGSGKYRERHRRGIPSIGMAPSPVCEAALVAERRSKKARKQKQTGGAAGIIPETK